MVLRPRWPQCCSRSLQDLVGPLPEHPDRLTDHCLRVKHLDFPVASVCELGELLAVHDGVGPSLIRHATLDGDVVGEVERPGSQARSSGPARAARLRPRRVQLTTPERRTLAPSRPARPSWRHPDAGSRSESVPARCRVRSARSAGGPPARGPPTPSRQRPSRDDPQCPVSRDRNYPFMHYLVTHTASRGQGRHLDRSRRSDGRKGGSCAPADRRVARRPAVPHDARSRCATCGSVVLGVRCARPPRLC
jgi:hypothetical protein